MKPVPKSENGRQLTLPCWLEASRVLNWTCDTLKLTSLTLLSTSGDFGAMLHYRCSKSTSKIAQHFKQATPDFPII